MRTHPIAALFLAFALAPAAFGDVSHSFSDGETISASKINTNFSEASKKFVVKNDGARIGYVMGASGNGWLVVNSSLYSTTLAATSGVYDYGTTTTVYYTTADCTGTAYMGSSYALDGSVAKSNGVLHYLPLGTATTTITAQSFYNGSCFASTTNNFSAKTMSTNSSSVTGFPDTLGTITITFE